MAIIDGIFKNYTYSNGRHKSLVGILFLAANIESHLEKILEPYNITLRQYRILRQLRAIYPGCIPISDLKEYLINKKADISRLAQRTYKAGWIEKNICENDKRVVYIKISERGIDLMGKVDKHENEFLEPVNILDSNTTEQFNEYLELMLSTFSSQITR